MVRGDKMEVMESIGKWYVELADQEYDGDSMILASKMVEVGLI